MKNKKISGAELRRRYGRGTLRGFTDGAKFAVIKPPQTLTTPLPKMDLSVLPESIDHKGYVDGFINGYYRRLRMDNDLYEKGY